MAKMFMSTIRSLQRQRDEADIFARGQEITSYNMMEQSDRLAEQKDDAEKRNMQLGLRTRRPWNSCSVLTVESSERGADMSMRIAGTPFVLSVTIAE
jgi:hypothetical protein